MALISLNNKDNNVTITVKTCDNALQINLSPDSTTVIGSAKVFDAFGDGMPTAPNASLPLANYLSSLKGLNKSATQIVLTFTSSNYAGGGGFSWTIAGNGITLAPVSFNLAEYTSRMDAYLVNIF